jgi:hypothetical protein
MSMFSSPSSVSTITTASSRAAFCTDSSLSDNGLLQCRLDTTLSHLPSRKRGNRPQCGLHAWTATRMQSDILYCRSCNIHLCVDCYEIFHTRSNLVATKEQLTVEYFKIIVMIFVVYSICIVCLGIVLYCIVLYSNVQVLVHFWNYFTKMGRKSSKK